MHLYTHLWLFPYERILKVKLPSERACIFFLRILLHISKLPSRKIFPIYAITSKGWVCWPSSRPCQRQVFTLFSILIRWFYYYEVYFSILCIILRFSFLFVFFVFALSHLFGAKMRVVKLETVTLWTRIPSSGGSEGYFVQKCCSNSIIFSTPITAGPL